MKNVFIIGSRGYHANYGGWETFVTNLVDNYNDCDTKFFVSELTNSKNKTLKKINENLTIIPININKQGGIQMFKYAIKSLNESLKYIEENRLENVYIYILGLKLLNYLSLKKSKIKKLNIKVFVNPDGLEWKRSKWGMIAKKFFLISEKYMLKSCDKIICDSKGIVDYVKETYPKVANKTTYIAYGSNPIDLNGVNEDKILNKYHLEKDNYCLIVGRCVPENNYEMTIKGFMNSKLNKDLVIISNLDSSNYFEELKQITNCVSDERIKFINGVYDSLELSVIRKNAYLYIHGHSVGGTNPSLIESLSITDLNLLYDVNFNRYAALDGALYFKDALSITKLLDNKDFLDKSKNKLGSKAKKIVKQNFTWQIIVDKYKEIFK